jgi:hypothetical protein
MINDPGASPSPFRHRRQVSFNRIAYTATSSHLRDSVLHGEEPLAEGTPSSSGNLKLGEELGDHVQRKGKGMMGFSPASSSENVGLGFGLDGETLPGLMCWLSEQVG